MTSMLYTTSIMNKKPNIPEEVIFGTKQFSYRTDGKVNFWLLFAMVTGAANDLLFHTNPPYGPLHHCYYQDWPVVLRAVVELFPLLASLLWARSMARWIRGMDELHRRTTLEACLFAITWTFFVITAWQHLKHEGILEAIFRSSHYFLGELALGFNLAGLTEYDFYYPLAVTLLCFFFFLSHTIFNRRYK